MLFLFFFYLSSKESSIILKKVGKIGGDDAQVRNRVKHILSCISKDVKFSISEVRVRGSGPRPPIYEVVLDDADDAEALRKSFSRFTRKRSPIACPPELKGVEVYNSATLGTRVRISILQVISTFNFNSFSFSCTIALWLQCLLPVYHFCIIYSQLFVLMFASDLVIHVCFSFFSSQTIAIAYKQAHPESVVVVQAYDSRPGIRIKASDSPSQMFRRYGFVDAIKELDPVGSLGLLDPDFKVLIFCFFCVGLLYLVGVLCFFVSFFVIVMYSCIMFVR